MTAARILLAEDDVMVAIDLAAELEAAGMVIAGITGSVSGALVLIEQNELDFAVLNISLQDGESYPAARQLLARGIPFAFLTSFETVEIDEGFRDIPLLKKPQTTGRIVEHLARLTATSGVADGQKSAGTDGNAGSNPRPKGPAGRNR